MKLAVISDEISYDFHTAFELGQQWNVSDFEIRRLGPERIPDHNPVWNDVVAGYVRNQGVRITALSPGLFKLRRSAPEAQAHLGARFERTLELAEKFSCNFVIIFGFEPEPGEDLTEPPQEVVDLLGKKADEAARRGVQLGLETSQGSFAATGKASRTLLEKVRHPALRINWDPANALAAGDTSPLHGYGEVASDVGEVHVKDYDGRKIVVVGAGKVDWPGTIAALRRDNFKGYLTLETHIKPRLTGTKACLDALRGFMRA